jgi:hypothetical protein
VARCMAEGLVSGEGFAVDASVVRADASRARRVSGDEFQFVQHEHATRAVREYLAGLDGQAEQATRYSVSLTDPGAVWTAAPGGPAFFGYSTSYLVGVEAGIVLDVEQRALIGRRAGCHEERLRAPARPGAEEVRLRHLRTRCQRLYQPIVEAVASGYFTTALRLSMGSLYVQSLTSWHTVCPPPPRR